MTILHLQFEKFTFEDEGDWLEVHEGGSENGNLYGRYSSKNIPYTITSHSRNLFIRLVTGDHRSAGSKFNITYKAGMLFENNVICT